MVDFLFGYGWMRVCYGKPLGFYHISEIRSSVEYFLELPAYCLGDTFSR